MAIFSFLGITFLTGSDRHQAISGIIVMDTLAQVTGLATDEQRIRLKIPDPEKGEETISDKVIERFGFHTKTSLAFMRPLHRLAEGHGYEVLLKEIDAVDNMGS